MGDSEMKTVIAWMAASLCLAADPKVREVPADGGHAEVTSLIALIANPGLFHGRRVSVIGFCALAFEESELYVHAEDEKQRLMMNRVGLQFDGVVAAPKSLNGKYVLVEGTFDAGPQGAQARTGGKITNISRAQPWPGAALKRP
jgi:hypothetical protein